MTVTTLRIVGIGGSVAPASKRRSALEAALSGAAGAGAENHLFDLRRLGLPMFNPALVAEPPPSAMELVDAA